MKRAVGRTDDQAIEEADLSANAETIAGNELRTGAGMKGRPRVHEARHARRSRTGIGEPLRLSRDRTERDHEHNKPRDAHAFNCDTRNASAPLTIALERSLSRYKSKAWGPSG